MVCEEQPGAQKLGKEDKCMHVWSVCITEREREREREILLTLGAGGR